MKKLLLLLILSFFSAQSFAGSCPDGSEPVKSISVDGTYFVYNCGGQASSSSILETQNSEKICEKVNLPKDITSGTKYGVCLADKTAFKSHGVQIVDKKDGHPVRAGNKSLRFELRDGDCNDPPPPAWNDCKTDRERFELSGHDMYSGEEWWYAWSIFISKDFTNISPALLDLGQFHLEPTPEGDPCCTLMFKNGEGGYNLENPIKNFELHQLLTHSEMVGRWNDILINFKLSKKDNGFIKLWLNKKLVYEYTGPTITKNTEYVYYKFGIYRGGLSRYLNHKNFSPEVEACFKNNGASKELINTTKKGGYSQVLGLGANSSSNKIYNQCKNLYKIKMPTQVVYYDELGEGETCKNLNLENLKYNCKDLKSQTLTGNVTSSSETTKTANKASTNNSKILEGSVKSSDINFPGNFYTKEIESCSAMSGTPSFNSSRSFNRVKGLIGYDWHADWEANSNSISPIHKDITEPIKVLMSATHNAIGNDNKANIKTAKNFLIDLAKADTLYDSIGYIEVKKKPGCYAGGDVNSPCWFHEYEFARGVFSNYMITALWLKDELSEQEFKTVDQYIKKMYKKFLKPIEFQKQDQGFYQMANGGTSILVYASWTNNKKLAAEEINHRFKEMERLFYEDGYINNNSFRGYRGQWYHSYGLDIALGYVYIADLWGAEVPEKLQKKLVKASEVANLAITDWDQFKSRKYSGIQFNVIEDPENAIKHTHQMAIALDTLMKIVAGVELERDAAYLQKRKYHTKDGIDDLIGFNPNCTLEALAFANNPEEMAKQDANGISADVEIHIVDDVHYQKEGQILIVYTGDPKMKPLNRHMGGLMMKCGLGLITGKKKDWLSFVSSESNDIKKARNQNCHYDYFQKSNDKQALELFKDVLSGTDSILDYLQK